MEEERKVDIWWVIFYLSCAYDKSDLILSIDFLLSPISFFFSFIFALKSSPSLFRLENKFFSWSILAYIRPTTVNKSLDCCWCFQRWSTNGIYLRFKIERRVFGTNERSCSDESVIALKADCDFDLATP